MTNGTGRLVAPAVPYLASEDAVRSLLSQRVTVIASNDTGAWLATLAPSTTPGVSEEIERLSALQRLPVTDLALTLEASRLRRVDSSVRVRTSYRLGSAPVAEHRDDIDVLATPDGWRLGGSRPVVPVSDGGTVPAWYLSGVAAQQDAGGDVVLTWPGTRTAGHDLADLTAVGVEASRRAVSGARTEGGIVVAAPDTASVYRALVPGTGEAAADFAAVTADVPGPGRGDIVVVNPDVWPDLDVREQQVVLTHELVHVAVGAAMGGGQPLWLAEGHADHVALGPVLLSGATRRQLAAGVLDDVDAGPPDIPDAADFASDAATAYPTSWLVVDYLARTYGAQAVLDLLALLAGAGQDAAATGAEDRTMRQVLGVGRAQLIQQWQADLAVLGLAPGAGPPGTAGGAPR